MFIMFHLVHARCTTVSDELSRLWRLAVLSPGIPAKEHKGVVDQLQSLNERGIVDYVAMWRCKISLQVLKNIVQHEKRNFISPSDHVMFYLLYEHQ